MTRYTLIGALLLAIGVIAGLLVRSPSQPPPGTSADKSPAVTVGAATRPPDNVEQAIADLQHQLDAERLARQDLETQLASLQAHIESLDIGEVRYRETPVPPSGTTPGHDVRSSLQGLIDAGIAPDRAEWIQKRLDQMELQQLYLTDQATREGWINQPRYREERARYQNAVAALRPELEPDTYDRLLYARGRTNRVLVRDVMQASPAALYGIKAGDIIVEYDGQRIFSPGELNKQIKQGNSGTMTLVRLQRDGMDVEIYLPRGPLGVRMSSTRVAP